MRVLLFSLVCLCSTVASADIDGDPLYANMQQTNGASFYAWRPFYSSSVDGERWRKDWLWPLYTQKGFQDEQYGRLLFFGYHNDFSADDDRYHTWVLPFWFQGTSAEGEDYYALFPFGGTIHEFLGRDTIHFVLFPIYGKSRINEVQTTSVLWPIGSRTKGGRVDRFRIWPFYARSTLEGEFEKKSVLWPIWNTVEYTNDRNPGGGFILMPFYGHIETERADNYWVFPPVFRYMNSDVQRIIHAPWPFIQLADGEMKKRIFWPLYGKKSLGTLTRQYWLWPIIWNNRTQYAAHEQRRQFVVPLFTHQRNIATKPVKGHAVGDVLSSYWKLWPLMSWERSGDRSRFRTLELWPLRNTPGIERNWAPWWTLYRRMNHGGEISHHLLWGLYRQTRGEERFEWSLLKGFAGYKKNDDQHRYRFLFMEFGGQEDQP